MRYNKSGINSTCMNEFTTSQETETPKENSQPAWHFFLYLTAFMSLGFLASGIGSILFQIINATIPNPFEPSSIYTEMSIQGVIKYGIASVLIAGPLYFALAHFINSLLRRGAIPTDSSVRKWLTYIVLFITATVILGDLVTFVWNALDGDLPLRFMLKVLSIFAISGSIFGFSFWDMRRNVADKNTSAPFGRGAIGATLIVLISGFFFIQSPAESRDRKIDTQTESNLSQTESAISDYYYKNQMLPKSLDDIVITSGRITYPYFDAIPKNISYQPTSNTTFTLCGDFLRESLSISQEETSAFRDITDSWNHAAGHVCFDREISLEPTTQTPVIQGVKVK